MLKTHGRFEYSPIIRFRIDRRIVPDEDAAQAEEELRERIAFFAAKWPGIACRVSRLLLARPFLPVAGQEKLVEALQRNAAWCWARRSKRTACRSIPMRATTAPPASRRCSTAPGRAACSRRTDTARMKSCACRTFTAPPKLSHALLELFEA